ncbi:MAG: LAGLIDADG family homing endonuclease [Acidobacteria bacterium]|nr:LAGLIDADG family homing endonuclease [Acidobacteriota bacterium]
MENEQDMTTSCSKGHPLAANVFVDSSGKERCRICTRAATKAWYDRVGAEKYKRERRVAKQNWRPPDMGAPAYDAEFGAWLSGFTDGEGCFSACITGDHLSIKFEIKLRADDGSVLEEIQKQLGVGRLYRCKPREWSKIKERPAIVYSVKHRMALYRTILAHFDRFPLRSKKSRDYEIWRQIVIIAASYPQTRGLRLMKAKGDIIRPLVESLRTIREYQ